MISDTTRISSVSTLLTAISTAIPIRGAASDIPVRFSPEGAVPGDRIIGLSKINRIVRFFGQRPQVQERLTRQILVALQTLLGTEDVAVSIDGPPELHNPNRNDSYERVIRGLRLLQQRQRHAQRGAGLPRQRPRSRARPHPPGRLRWRR